MAAYLMFKIGDMVVHPQHGVGQVAKLEEREFEPGVMRRYYEISIPGGSTLWVPVDLPNSGLRRLAQRSEIVHCRAILEAHPSPLDDDGRNRQSGLAIRLKQGSIAAHCEVVRDLSAYGTHKPITGSIAAFLQATQGVLNQEWALVEGITVSAAAYEIEMLLEKSKSSVRESKTESIGK